MNNTAIERRFKLYESEKVVTGDCSPTAIERAAVLLYRDVSIWLETMPEPGGNDSPNKELTWTSIGGIPTGGICKGIDIDVSRVHPQYGRLIIAALDEHGQSAGLDSEGGFMIVVSPSYKVADDGHSAYYLISFPKNKAADMWTFQDDREGWKKITDPVVKKARLIELRGIFHFAQSSASTMGIR